MDRRQIRIIFRMGVLFISILFLSSGCLTPPKEHAPKKGVLNNVYVFRDLVQVDLDNDGQKEIIAIYTPALNSSGVKVIKFYGDKGEVVFERNFDTPNLKFRMKGRAPTLIAEYKSEATGCSSGITKDFYRWDGNAFVAVKK
ncbi:MAG: hypothetical protein PHW54_06980 [Candidatus Omnitrophica bacterium]|nr:hypothetical protein [Candidatus Omnitrophota bacterium]